MTGKHEVFHWA